MQTAILTAPQQVAIREKPCPEPASGQVRIRMKMISICGSDVHLYKGDWQHRTAFPVLPGHEGIGVIDAVGEGVTCFELGQRVVIEPNFPCGQCRTCWRGQGNICPNKRIFGILEAGCFAEYAIVPAQFAWALPEQISDEDAVLVEPTAVAWHALQKATLHFGDTIAVIGLGAIGQLVTHIALAAGYRVVVKDYVQAKMNLAESWGAIPIRLIEGEPVIPQVAAICSRANVVAVFECGGTARTTEIAIGVAPIGAEIVIVGLAHEPVSFTTLDITPRGLSILTSMIYDHPADFSRVISLIAQGTIQPSKIISHRCTFDQLPAAFALAASGNQTKIILTVT